MECKPGITGLWQVEGRSKTTFDGMVRMDIRYSRDKSLLSDLRLLLKTPAALLSAKGHIDKRRYRMIALGDRIWILGAQQ